MGPLETIWEEKNGELICVFHRDQAWRTIAKRKFDFPMDAERVAWLMNDAFQAGVKAQQEATRNLLGIKP